MLKKDGKRVDCVYRNYNVNILVEQTSQKVNSTLCIRSSTETKRKNKRPIGVTKTGNRDEPTRKPDRNYRDVSTHRKLRHTWRA